MSLINVNKLTFAYEGSHDNIFENVSFQIDSDWKLGFTGRNGRGKTTFLKLLCGEYEYEGNISASVDFEYFPFLIDNSAQIALDVVYGVNPDCELWETVRELNLLELDESALYRPFGSLSHGERTKIMLAALFLKRNGFLLVDEPTNHLDLHGREVLSKYLAGKKGYIVVSHDRAFLDGCVDHVLAINKSDIEIVQGSFSSWYYNKKLRDDGELAQNENLKKEIKRLEKAAEQKSVWAESVEKTKYGTKNSGLRPDRGYIGHKSAKMMKSSKALQQRRQGVIEEKSSLLKNVENENAISLKCLEYRSHRLLSVENLCVYYGDARICDEISFTVEQGDRIALCGKNGSGKSSVLKIICAREEIAYTGEVKIGGNMKISYVSQETAFLKGSLSAYADEKGIDESLFKCVLKKMDFSREQFEKPLETYSEGQKKKVLLAASVCDRAHLYVWDEPLNYIDVISRIQLEELILSYEPTLIFVEHDRTFCENAATKTVEIKRAE